jgi:hypothetical protein
MAVIASSGAPNGGSFVSSHNDGSPR